MLQSSKYAFNAFGMNNLTINIRQKHAFFVKFNTINGSNTELTSSVKTADKPKLKIDNQELNQYNKKRIITDKMSYGDFSIHFYNTDAVNAMVKSYMHYYFADFRQTSISAWKNDVIDPTFNQGNGSGFGFQPQTDNPYYFSTIELYQLFGQQKYDKYTFINPKISSIDYDGNDYSSSELSDVSMTFVYEGLLLDLNQAVNNADSMDSSATIKTSNVIKNNNLTTIDSGMPVGSPEAAIVHYNPQSNAGKAGNRSGAISQANIDLETFQLPGDSTGWKIDPKTGLPIKPTTRGVLTTENNDHFNTRNKRQTGNAQTGSDGGSLLDRITSTIGGIFGGGSETKQLGGSTIGPQYQGTSGSVNSSTVNQSVALTPHDYGKGIYED